MFNYQYFNLIQYFFFRCNKPNKTTLPPNYAVLPLAAPWRPLNISTILGKKWHTYCFPNVHFHRCPSTRMNGIAAERFLLRQKWWQMQLSDHLGMLFHTLSSLTWHHNRQWTVRKDKEFPLTMRAWSPNLPRDAFLLHSFINLRDCLALLQVTVQIEPQKQCCIFILQHSVTCCSSIGCWLANYSDNMT